MKKDKAADKETDKGTGKAVKSAAASAKEDAVGGDLLEIKHLLQLNSEGKATNVQKEQLLRLMERYWFAVKRDKGAPRPSDELDLDGPVVFKAFMEACWTDAFAQTPAQPDTGNNGDSKEIGETEDIGVDWDRMYQRVVASEIVAEVNIEARSAAHNSGAATSIIVPLKKKTGKLVWAAAALVLMALGIGGWWVFQGTKARQSMVINQPRQDIAAPKGAKAVLVLADGRRLALDSASSGLLASEGNTSVRLNANNSLNYTANATGTAGALLYNELKVLKGSQPVSVTLSDGTKVWLNVGSSLRYPMVFGGQVRAVTLNGEAYFEVAHESTRPFVVQHGILKVKVLGTRFNINSYQDEPTLKVSLVEGAVDVEKQRQHLILHAGEQAMTTQAASEGLKLNKQVDLDQVLSWKSSEFVFGDESDFRDIMRQIARWYDVDIQYAGRVDTKFWGAISRTASLQQVLQLLEATGGVRFKLTGRQLEVIPIQ